MSQFAFLQREWPPVFDAAARAEGAVQIDPRSACFYARRALELAIAWAYKSDAALRLPSRSWRPRCANATRSSRRCWRTNPRWTRS